MHSYRIQRPRAMKSINCLLVPMITQKLQSYFSFRNVEDQRKGTLGFLLQRAFSLVFFIATQKGVSIMTQKRSFITLSDEQTLAWYQHHVQVLHGYALALALKAGLSPAEAARLWENWHG